MTGAHGMNDLDTPLAGIRVVELSHVLAGPICGLMLADLGAEVIKVERPPKGDGQRWDVSADDTLGTDSASFFMINRGKDSVVLDLKSAADKAALWDLIGSADCLVENYRVGVLDKLGFGYDAVKARYPGIVYCSISGYGRSGPWAQRGGFDLIMQGMSGIMSFTGDKGSTHPTKCGPPITDIAAGVLAALGVVAALLRKVRTGNGDHVETTLLETGVMFTYLQTALALASGVDPKPMGTGYPTYTPYEAFEAADGWIAFGTTAGRESWLKLLDILDLTDIADDPRFATTADRVANRDALGALLTERLRTEPRDHWVERLNAAGMPCGPVLTISEMLQHPQVVARGAIADYPHADLGSAKAIACPIRFQDAEAPIKKSAPLLGQKGVVSDPSL